MPWISRRSQIRPSGDSGEVLCRSATRLGFPTDHKLCTDAGGLEFFWMGVSANRGSPPPTQIHTHTHTLTQYNPLLCAWNWESSADSWFLGTIVWQRVNIFWEFFLGEWIYVNERKSARKENDYLAWRSEGSLHVPADMYIITEWDWGLRVLLALTWERGLHPEIYLEASCG